MNIDGHATSTPSRGRKDRRILTGWTSPGCWVCGCCAAITKYVRGIKQVRNKSLSIGTMSTKQKTDEVYAKAHFHDLKQHLKCSEHHCFCYVNPTTGDHKVLDLLTLVIWARKMVCAFKRLTDFQLLVFTLDHRTRLQCA